MKDTKLKIILEKYNKLNKEEINKLKLEEKLELELKYRNKYINMINKCNKSKKEKFIEKKILNKRDKQEIKFNINKLQFLENKNTLKKDLNYEGNIINMKKNNKKRNRLNIKKNTYIIILIFFNLIMQSNNMIEYKFSSITLKIQANGNIAILASNFFNNYPPEFIYINGNQTLTITNRYEFNLILILQMSQI